MSSSLSFKVTLPSNALDILAFLTFCKKREIPFPKGYDVTKVCRLYVDALDDITAPAFLAAHGKDVEILDHMVLLQEEEAGHWESEFVCWEPDHPEVPRIEECFTKSLDCLRKVKAFREAVLAVEE